MIPKLRFPEFSGEWKVKRIVDIGKVITGGTPATSDPSLYGDVFDFVAPGDMNDGRYVLRTKQHLSEKGFRKSRIIPPGSTLFVCIGSTIGKTAQINKESTTNQQINSVVASENYDKDFVYLTLDRVSSEIANYAGEQAVPIINKTDFQKNKLIMPILSEQQKIAGFLTVVDERIAAIDKKVVLLQRYKKGVMQKIFTQKLRFRDKNGNDYPDWQTKKLGEVVNIQTGKKDVNQGNPKGVYPFFTCAREHTYSDEYSFEGEAIMIAGNGEVGLCTYYNGRFEAYQRTYVLQDFTISADYLFIYLKSAFQGFAESQKQQGSMPYIKLSTLQDFVVPIQTNKEQQQIADFVTALDDKINLEKTKLEQVKQLKRSLLQRMLV